MARCHAKWVIMMRKSMVLHDEGNHKCDGGDDADIDNDDDNGNDDDVNEVDFDEDDDEDVDFEDATRRDDLD